MIGVDVIVIGLAIAAFGVYAFMTRREGKEEAPALGSVSDRWIAEHRSQSRD